MKTLYKIAIALGITEHIYLFLLILNFLKNNTMDLMGVIIVAVLGVSGLSCIYIQSNRDALATEREKDE